MRAGDRVGVAVSGGADSVAMLRVLLELKEELGIVLAVVHLNHQIRGEEADRDEQFVRELAHHHHQQLLCTCRDVPACAKSKGIGLEAAGREVRYSYFRALMENGNLDKVATAHTADDQAETVLMRVIRGAGTKGLAGIHPVHKTGAKGHAIVRPMLGVRRAEIESYLRGVKQEWREDSSNQDPRHLRNRVRHNLLPLLQTEFNPGVVEALTGLAEIARAEEEVWRGIVGEKLESGVSTAALRSWPVAVQRRVLRAMAGEASLSLEDVERVRELAAGHSGREVELANGWRAVADRQELRFEKSEASEGTDYELPLKIPGSVRVRQLGCVIKAFFVPEQARSSGYNPARLDPQKLAPELVIRNWRAGDRFWPAHTKSEKKVKELLQERRVPSAEKARWPVAVSRAEIVWMRGFAPGRNYLAGPECGHPLAIEEIAENEL